MGSLQLAVIFGCLSVVCATSMARLESDLETYPSHHDDLEPSTGDEFDDDGWAIPAGEDLDEYRTDYPEDYDYSTEEPESYDYSTEEPESYESTTEVSESFNSMDEDDDSRVFGMDKNTVKEDGEGEMDEGDLGIDSVVDCRRNRTEAMLQLINETYVLMQDLPPPDVDNSTCHWKNRTAFVKKFAFRVMAIIEKRGSHKRWDPSHHHKHHRGPSHHRSRGPNEEFPLPHMLPSSPTDGRIPAQMSAGVPDRRPRPLPSAESKGFMGNNGGGGGMGPTPGKPPSSSSTGNAMIGQVMGSIFGQKTSTTSNQKPAGGRWGAWRNMEGEQKQGGGPGKGSGGQWKAGETQPAEGGKQGGPGQRWGGKGAGGGWGGGGRRGGGRGGGEGGRGEGGRGGGEGGRGGGERGRGGGEGGRGGGGRGGGERGGGGRGGGEGGRGGRGGGEGGRGGGGRGGGRGGREGREGGGEGGALGPHVNHSRQPGAGTQTDNNTGSSNSMSFPNPFRRPQSPSSSMGMGLGGGSGAPSPPGSPGAGTGGANLGNALLGLMEKLGTVGKGAGAGTGSANIMSLLSLLNRRR